MHARLAIPGALALLLAGCAQTPPPAPPPPPLPAHLGPPPAATCKVAPYQISEGGTGTVQMTVSNDGGYCAATLTAANGKPYDAPLETVLPRLGHARVVKYNGKTSIEYESNPGATGTDDFTVRLIERGKPGFTTVNVHVLLAPPGAAAPRA